MWFSWFLTVSIGIKSNYETCISRACTFYHHFPINYSRKFMLSYQLHLISVIIYISFDYLLFLTTRHWDVCVCVCVPLCWRWWALIILCIQQNLGSYSLLHFPAPANNWMPSVALHNYFCSCICTRLKYSHASPIQSMYRRGASSFRSVPV